MNKYIKLLTDKKFRFSVLTAHGVYNRLSDERFLKKAFKINMGKELNLDNPITFNEKLQWLKLNDRKPEYTKMVDKYEAKKYVAEKIGEEYIIPTLGVWDNFDDIDFNSLPNQFVLKCTHDSGTIVICKDKSKFDVQAAKNKINARMSYNYFYKWREWPYKNAKPRIIAEEFMQDRDYEYLNVFKIFNFNGEPKIIQTIQNDKTPNETIDYFDTEWNLLELKQNFPNSITPVSKPQTLEEMLTLARILSKDTSPFIRTDFYEINGKVYFSEFTFYSDAGFAKFTPQKWDTILGDWITLPKNV